MHIKQFQILKKYSTSILEKPDQDLPENINSLNVFRIKILCVGFICVGLLMLLIDYNVLLLQKELDLHYYYLWFDTILIGIGILSGLILMGIQIYCRKQLLLEQSTVVLISLFMLIWAGALGALEYSTHGSVSTIIICVLILATAIYLKNWQITIIYLASLVTFIVCKKGFSGMPTNFFVDHINLIPLFTFGWVLSRILYVHKLESLLNRKELEKIQKELEQRVLKRTRELSILNAELKKEITEKGKIQNKLNNAQKMELIGTMASGIAHDLNNVLSGINTYPEVLLMDMDRDDPMRKPLETIHQSGQKAADIIQDMLMLARRSVPIKDLVNLNYVIKEYLKSPEFKKLCSIHTNIEVDTGFEEDCQTIKGSKIHLFTTIMNLITNAAEAMPNGGKITIHTKNRSLDKSMDMCKVVKEGDYLRLSITDTGIGMEKKDQDRIFEPFYTSKRMGKSGTGLGLALVWGTVKDHKGYIEVKSKVNEGTCFILYFPVLKERVNMYEKPNISPIIPGNGETVLVVDDLEEQLFFAISILEKFNYNVHCELGGEKAIKYMKEHTADLIILDMNMDPGMNGLQAYKEIIKYHPGQKAIIASGFSDESLIEQARAYGITSYIKKPYSLKKLTDTVRKELSKETRY